MTFRNGQFNTARLRNSHSITKIRSPEGVCFEMNFHDDGTLQDIRVSRSNSGAIQSRSNMLSRPKVVLNDIRLVLGDLISQASKTWGG